jgi:flagellar basal body-associated protein FliL
MMQKKQRGMTLISWIIILSLAAIQIVAAIRIVPVYLTFSSVKKVMEEVKEDAASHGATPAQLKVMIDKRLSINNIRELLGNKTAFTFTKTKDGMNISYYYESRGPIYGNLEFLATFEHEVEVPSK